MYDQLKNLDAREVELPDTVFIRDIDTKVFQSIVLQCLAKIEGIGLVEGTLFDNLLGRDLERVKGIHVSQDQKQHSVEVRIEINVGYGVDIPQKAAEVQEKISEEISHWTGLHVSSVHVIFKDLLLPKKETPKEIQGEFGDLL